MSDRGSVTRSVPTYLDGIAASRSLTGHHHFVLERLSQITLLGELDTTAETVDVLGRLLRNVIQSLKPEAASSKLWTDAPLAMADFLVASGVHGYRGGDFWSGVMELTSLPKQVYQRRWGEAFNKTLSKYELPRFEALTEEHSHPFVSRIIAHGGIPNYCLDDFFGKLLEPTVRNGEHLGRSPSEIIAEWDRGHSTFVGIDKPVRRFLVYGGDVSASLLGRCVEMVEQGLAGEGSLNAAMLGLPTRIVDRFSSWLERNEVRLSARRTTASRSMARPVLSYDPWAPDALDLTLPAEHVSGEDAGLTWTATAVGWNRCLPAATIRDARGTMTRPTEVRLTSPFARLEVKLAREAGALRSWPFSGLSLDTPLMAFDPDSGHHIDPTNGLPNTDIWIIVPRTIQISVEREGIPHPIAVREEFPVMAGGWVNFKGLHVDLQGCSQVVLVDDMGQRTTVRIPVTARSQTPFLEAGQPSSLHIGSERGAPFHGTPPTLCLPLPMRAGVAFDPAGWRIRVRSFDDARPRVDVQFLGSDAGKATRGTDGLLRIDLANTAILGAAPMGTFEITARGPLGRDAAFKLQCLPPFTIEGIHRPIV